MGGDTHKTQIQQASEYEKERRRKWEARKQLLGLKAARTSWRNYYKFTGKLPSYKLFSRINISQKIGEPDFMPKKRANIEVLSYLTPWELIFKVSLLSKNFYILTWNIEVIKRILVTNLGQSKFQEVKYKLGKQFLANEDIPSHLKTKNLNVSSSSSEDFSEASGHNINLDSSTTSGEEELINKRIKNFEPRTRKRERIEFKKITFAKVLTKLHGRKKQIRVNDVIDSDLSSTEEEKFIDRTIRKSRKDIRSKKIKKYANVLEDTVDFLRKLMTFIAKVKT